MTLCHTLGKAFVHLSPHTSDNLDTIKETRVSHKEHSLLNDYLIQIYEFKEKVIDTKKKLAEVGHKFSVLFCSNI